MTAVFPLSLHIIRKPNASSRGEGLCAVARAIRIFTTMDAHENDSYLSYTRVGYEKLFRMAQRASILHETRSSGPVQHRDDVSHDHLNNNRGQGASAGTQPVYNATTVESVPGSMTSEIEWNGAPIALETLQSSADPSLSNWTGIGQAIPYPVLSEWNFDMLLEGNFAPWA